MRDHHKVFPFLISLLTLLIVSEMTTFSFLLSDRDTTRKGYLEDTFLDFTEIATKQGYMSERHAVVTEDGYILKLYRLISQHCEDLRKPPVLLMHGLLLSSDLWIDAGPNISLAYLLADACYDLWVGNVRGNYLGRKHVKLDPDNDKQFWDFSFDEMGLYDAPAIIDYVLNATGSEKLNYIGFSQGGGMLTILCSEKPEYCDKVLTFIALAPAVRMTNTKSAVFRFTCEFMRNFSGSLATNGIYEVFGKNSLIQNVLDILCQIPLAEASSFCQLVIAIIDSSNPGSIESKTIRKLFSHVPSGTSVKNLIRFAQSVSTEKFNKFDYGQETNFEIYGDKTAPEYDLSKLTLPVLIIQGLSDTIVDIRDSEWLKEILPNAELKVVEDKLWNHFDMMYSHFSPTLLFPIINKHLLKYVIQE